MSVPAQNRRRSTACERDHTVSITPPGYFEQQYGPRGWEWYNRLANVVEHSKPGPILDVGAGHRLFVEAATRWGLDCVGLKELRTGLRSPVRAVPTYGWSAVYSRSGCRSTTSNFKPFRCTR